MRTSSDIQTSLAPITLWVEDRLTQTVLTRFWQDKDIRVQVAHGKDGVHAQVNLAYQESLSNPQARPRALVVGFVDRDFESAHRAVWTDPKTRVFRTRTHEIENMLLDFELWSVIVPQTSAADFETMALEIAQSLRWWMACKATMQAIQRVCSPQLPADPQRPDQPHRHFTREQALDYIGQACLWRRDPAALTSARSLRRWVARLGIAYGHHLRTRCDGRERWRSTFSGKEIFGMMLNHAPSIKAHLAGLKGTARSEKWAGLLADAARNLPTSTLARSLRELRQILRVRTGLTP